MIRGSFWGGGGFGPPRISDPWTTYCTFLIRVAMWPISGLVPAPRAIASSSSASATHPVPVMQTEHVQRFKVCYSRAQKFFTVPLDPQYHLCWMKHIGTASTQKSLHTCSLCLHHWRLPQFALKYPCNPPPPPGDHHLATVSPPHPGYRRALPGSLQGGGRVGHQVQ